MAGRPLWCTDCAGLQGYTPLAAAVVADVLAHSIPGLNILLSLLSEPLGAAAGVAYLMTVSGHACSDWGHASWSTVMSRAQGRHEIDSY